MTTSKEAIPILRGELQKFLDRANRFMVAVQWKPKVGVFQKEADGQKSPMQQYKERVGEIKEDEVSVLNAARSVAGGEQVLFPDNLNNALRAVRTGIQLGLRIVELYGKASNLDALMEQNNRGSLLERQKEEFRGKQQTAAAIALFTTAYYIVTEIAPRMRDADTVITDFRGIPEIVLRGPIESMQCAMFYYGAYLEKGRPVTTEKEFLQITHQYWKGILDEVKLRKDSLQYAEPFTDRTYKLEESEFDINGFETELCRSRISIPVKRVLFSQIVGNELAKHDADQLTERMICFNPKEKRNPMFDLGGFPTIRMWRGKPGGGKSTMIAATATKLTDLCEWLEYPFLFWQMPDTIISYLQGKTAENMANWMAPLHDPSLLVFGVIDDAEMVLGSRSRQNVSEGNELAVGVYLRQSESAIAIWYGGSTLILATNLPEKLDPAVLSRVQLSTNIDGAKTSHDFMDQSRLWLQQYIEVDPTFVDITPPPDYEYFSDQKFTRKIVEAKKSGQPSGLAISDVLRKIADQYDRSDHRFFGALFTSMLAVHPKFSSRDITNIQRIVSARIMDFDFPRIWFDKPGEFFHQPYDKKRSILVEMMRSTMNGKPLSEIYYEEAIRYMEELVQIGDMARQRRIEERVEEIEIYNAANELVDARKLGGVQK